MVQPIPIGDNDFLLAWDRLLEQFIVRYFPVMEQHYLKIFQ